MEFGVKGAAGGGSMPIPLDLCFQSATQRQLRSVDLAWKRDVPYIQTVAVLQLLPSDAQIQYYRTAVKHGTRWCGFSRLCACAVWSAKRRPCDSLNTQTLYGNVPFYANDRQQGLSSS